MGSPVLFLRLEGPLQSWGVRSRWDVRDTGTEPTKSGIIGLLGCALGYPMNDPRLETELDAGLRFGVRVEKQGRVTRDFQTITGFLPTSGGGYKHGGGTAVSLEGLKSNLDSEPSTIISPRHYLEDAAFLVALVETGRVPDLLEHCAEAVQQPTWPLFLGRKACVPTRPVFAGLFNNEYESLEDALERHPWEWLGSNYQNRTRPDRLSYLLGYVEDESGPLVRQDAIRINTARQYGFRSSRELHLKSVPSLIKSDTAVEEALS